MTRLINFSKAINEALEQAMTIDDSVICYGLGVDDPKGIFGTTLGLKEKFGGQRVFDMPTSENAMTGIAIGASLNGIRPVMTHQRLDFFLLAMDQLVNNAAKWHYMFGSKACVPITIRLILGRGWGQGPTHSQNLQAWFAHIPGLKVVMPTTARDAKGLLLESIFDDNPVLFLEHRWLYNLESDVPEDVFYLPLGIAACLKEGCDISIISCSYMTVEALKAVKTLEKNGISCDLLDLRTISPLDDEAIFSSVRKTGRVLVLDTGASQGSFAGEIIARISMACYGSLKQAPQRLALPNFPTPTSFSLTKAYYKRSNDIISIVGEIMGKKIFLEKNIRGSLHDVPGEWFKGPF